MTRQAVLHTTQAAQPAGQEVSALTDAIQTLAATLKQQNIPHMLQEPLKNHTTFQIGGPAAVFCVPETHKQLCSIVQTAAESAVPLFLLGNGSNLLFEDAGFPGVVVSMRRFAAIETQGNTLVVGAGASLEDVCKAACDAGLSGMEFAYGIPASVGGAVYMDAGAFDSEMRSVLQSVAFMDEACAVRSLPADALQLGYRTSLFQQKRWCILSATFALAPGDKNEILRKMDDNLAYRRQKQPLDTPSAGSAFKRPKGAFAGALIDQCGLRGYRVGQAAISEKHCGFIVNLGGATSKEVQQLAAHVVETVRQQTGFLLEQEVQLVQAGRV